MDLRNLGAAVDPGTAVLLSAGAQPTVSDWRRAVPTEVALGAVILAVMAGALGGRMLTRPPPPRPVPLKTWSLTLPNNVRLPSDTHPVAISPDGRNLVHLSISVGGRRALVLRPMDQLLSQQIPGTER